MIDNLINNYYQLLNYQIYKKFKLTLIIVMIIARAHVLLWTRVYTIINIKSSLNFKIFNNFTLILKFF